MSKQSDALREYFDKNGILQKEVCEVLGLHSGTVSSILSGRFGISKKVAKRLADVYGFDLEFLLTGEGVLIPPPGTVRISQSQRVSGHSTGIQAVGDHALLAENAQLREQLEQCRAEKDRLLGIIETLTKK